MGVLRYQCTVLLFLIFRFIIRINIRIGRNKSRDFHFYSFSFFILFIFIFSFNLPNNNVGRSVNQSITKKALVTKATHDIKHTDINFVNVCLILVYMDNMHTCNTIERNDKVEFGDYVLALADSYGGTINDEEQEFQREPVPVECEIQVRTFY